MVFDLTLKKRNIGILIIIISIIFFIAMLSFTLEVLALNRFLHKDCPLPSDVCPFNKTVPSQSVIGFTAVAALLALGLYLTLSKDPVTEKVAVSKKDLQLSLKELKGDEKKVLELIVEEGAIFQAALVEKSGLSKVKVTRILDVLEGKGLVERKRRGMSNVVILKAG